MACNAATAPPKLPCPPPYPPQPSSALVAHDDVAHPSPQPSEPSSHSTSATTSRFRSLSRERRLPDASSSQPPRHETAQPPATTRSASGRRTHRRGYVRPQGTYFAASARSRESVMSLGSIAHLQYYFARTGLLDGKGAQLAPRKKSVPHSTLDLSFLEASSSSSRTSTSASDADSSYASMSSSPDRSSLDRIETRALSTTGDDVGDADDDDDDFPQYALSDLHPGMLPPTVSTYHHREMPLPKPPTIAELRSDLETSLRQAADALVEAEQRKSGTYIEPPNAPCHPNMPEENTQGWYELQGMHVLDLLTLAIRAAKIYYTAHELPDRLVSIKSEKQLRADLLAVMEVLKQMATRGFRGGMKDDEIKLMRAWIDSVWAILAREEEIDAAERAEREAWTWLSGDWSGREHERERAFLISMDSSPTADPLPEWLPLTESSSELPTPFLRAMQNGLRLVRLHNAAVKKSRRRFGAIPTFHTDTQKPYRCADNLRYWVKAAELRFEVRLKFDILGVVYDSDPSVWPPFEAAILAWCRHVREEIAAELEN